jgi:integrase
MAKRTLNDRIIKALKPAKPGKRVDVWDALVPGLGVRVTDTGVKTFTLVTRYPGHKNPARRALGGYGEITLEQARAKAREWLSLIQRGVDPQVEIERQRLAEQRKRAGTFASVAQDFITEKLSKERQGDDAERTLRRFIEAWGDRPITEIAPLDVLAVIRPIKSTAPYMAHSMLTTIKRFFSWVIDQHVYGLETSPCDRLRPKNIIGERKPRQRVLSEDEIFALWRAASRTPYPYGPMLRMLLLTGQRHSDVAKAPWSEINFERREWIIAAGRFKSDVQHLVPLSDAMVTLLAELPRFKSSDYLFTYWGRRAGRGVIGGIKDDLDARMERTLKAMARRRGEDPSRVKLAPFVIHDIRRTMRTRLTQLKVPTEVAEAVIGHGKRGLERHYNLYEYADEKRDALDRWAARVRSIVEPAPANVVPLAVQSGR